MESLRRIRKANLVLGTFLLLGINGVGALPRMYVDPAAHKGVQNQVGPGIVSVYLQQKDDAREPLAPVQGSSSTALAGHPDTGQRVLVFLRNGYKDDLINFYPRITLLIFAAMSSIHVLMSSLIRRQSA